MGTLFWIVVAGLAAYAALLYNSLVGVKHAVAKAWANIDVLLKQRHDELPKLVDTCRQHMAHEQATLEKVVQARAGVSAARESHDLAALGAAENQLRRGLGALFAVAESYPELRTSETFLHLQSRISGLENAIADRREFYNESVNIHNVRIAQFPELLLARPLGFTPFEPLRFEAEELKDVDIGARFGSR